MTFPDSPLMIVDGFNSPDVLPLTIKSILSPKCFSTSCQVIAGDFPARLALVETIALLVNAHKAITSSCSVIRTAIVSKSPQSNDEILLLAGSTWVIASGQRARILSRSLSLFYRPVSKVWIITTRLQCLWMRLRIYG